MDRSSEIKRHVAHFGAISFNYAITGAIVTGIALISVFLAWLFFAMGSMLLIAYYAILAIITIFSLFLLLFHEGFRSLYTLFSFEKLGEMGDYLAELSPKILNAVPYMALISGILCVISFVCLMFDRKWEKAKPRLIILAVCVVMLVVLAILILAGIIAIAKEAQ